MDLLLTDLSQVSEADPGEGGQQRLVPICVLGLGAGAFREGIEAMGGPGRSKSESIEALEEAVQIIHAYWSGTRALPRELGISMGRLDRELR